MVGLASCFDSSCQILPIKSFHEVNFDAIEPKTLVLFDVDETLIQPRDALVMNLFSPQGKELIARFKQKYPALDVTYIHSLMSLQAARPLIEPDIIPIITRLKQREIPVIACSYMYTGPYGVLSTTQEWRYEHLKLLGFNGSYDDRIINFKFGSKNPVFYKGILAVDLSPKGPVMGMLLDSMILQPTKIVVFDDRLDHLQSIEEECKKRGIRCEGYHYQGAIERPWDELLAQFQVEYLLAHKKWLSDQMARAMMEPR